ncbi:hypothetical protein D1647_08570 [Alistipes sp. Z76]|nr:hypothetical protein [Alistipes sp. Z76]
MYDIGSIVIVDGLICYSEAPRSGCRPSSRSVARRGSGLRFEELRGPQPPASGGPQLVLHSFAVSAGRGPNPYIHENIATL